MTTKIFLISFCLSLFATVMSWVGLGDASVVIKIMLCFFTFAFSQAFLELFFEEIIKGIKDLTWKRKR